MSRYDYDIACDSDLNEHERYRKQFARDHNITEAEASKHPFVQIHKKAYDDIRKMNLMLDYGVFDSSGLTKK